MSTKTPPTKRKPRKKEAPDVFLEQYASPVSSASDTQEDTEVQDSDQQFLEDYTAKRPDTKTQELGKQVDELSSEHTQAGDVEGEEEEKEEDGSEREDEEGTTKKPITPEKGRLNVRENISETVNNISETISPAIDKASNLRTVGGIGLLLAVLTLLLFVVVQVNSQGDTRLKQLWYMLNGRTELQGKVQIVQGSINGASGNFSGGGTFSAPPTPGWNGTSTGSSASSTTSASAPTPTTTFTPLTSSPFRTITL